MKKDFNALRGDSKTLSFSIFQMYFSSMTNIKDDILGKCSFKDHFSSEIFDNYHKFDY